MIWLLSEFIKKRTKEYRSALELWSEWQINRFAETTGQEFRKALSNLKIEGVNSLIIDLRENISSSLFFIGVCEIFLW